MAHFAELDNNNIVLRVLVVADADTAGPDGVEVEAIGTQFCTDLLGGVWIQTSYNDTMRTRFAGAGYTYDPHRDVFLTPRPYTSWTLDSETTEWMPPTPYPDVPEGDPFYGWHELTTSWIEVENE